MKGCLLWTKGASSSLGVVPRPIASLLTSTGLSPSLRHEFSSVGELLSSDDVGDGALKVAPDDLSPGMELGGQIPLIPRPGIALG